MEEAPVVPETMRTFQRRTLCGCTVLCVLKLSGWGLPGEHADARLRDFVCGIDLRRGVFYGIMHRALVKGSVLCGLQGVPERAAEGARSSRQLLQGTKTKLTAASVNFSPDFSWSMIRILILQASCNRSIAQPRSSFVGKTLPTTKP